MIRSILGLLFLILYVIGSISSVNIMEYKNIDYEDDGIIPTLIIVLPIIHWIFISRNKKGNFNFKKVLEKYFNFPKQKD